MLIYMYYRVPFLGRACIFCSSSTAQICGNPESVRSDSFRSGTVALAAGSILWAL